MSTLASFSHQALRLLTEGLPGVVYEMEWRPGAPASAELRAVEKGWPWRDGAFVPVRLAGSVEDLLGEREGEIIGDPDWWFSRLHPEDRARVIEQLERLWKERKLTLRYRLMRPDGYVLHVQDTMLLFPPEQEKLGRLVGIWMDVSDQETDRELLAKAFELSPNAIAIVRWDDWRLLVANQAFEKMTGYPLEKITGRAVDDMFHWPSEGVRRRVMEMLEAKGGVRGVHLRLHTAQGAILDCELHATYVEIMGEPCLLIEAHDITEQLAHARRLREQERQLRLFVDALPDGLAVHDGESILFANAMAKRWFGEDCEGKPLICYVLAEDRVQLKQNLARLLSGERKGGSNTLRLMRADGTWFWAETHATPLDYDYKGKKAFLCVIRDISERLQLERKLREAQKMEAIATLAGGIAHDFNNLLAAIIGNLYLIRQLAGDNDKIVDKIRRIEDSARRAAEMIQQLLTFARRVEPRTAPLDLRAFLKELYKLARGMVPESIDFEIHYDTGRDFDVLADASQIQQAVLNYIKNALDAVREGGGTKIVLRLDDAPPPDALAGEDASRRAWAHIAVEDDGPGLDEQAMAHAFEPFFTTKGPEKGTGLGLAVVQGIAAQHGGFCALENAPEKGAIAHLWLPLMEKEAFESIRPMEEEKERVPFGKGEAVLLVDDDDILREALAEVLKELGYQVLAAADAEQAKRLFAQHRGRIRALLSDIVMPGESGVELAEQLRQMQPDLPVILQTGYGDDMEPQARRLRDVVLLQKPVPVEALARTLRDLLERDSQNG